MPESFFWWLLRSNGSDAMNTMLVLHRWPYCLRSIGQEVAHPARLVMICHVSHPDDSLTGVNDMLKNKPLQTGDAEAACMIPELW